MNKLLALLLALCMVLTLCACAAPEKKETTAPDESATTAAPTENEKAPDAPAYPITVTDMAGRTVVIPARPERIISGYYISTSAVLALGLEDRLVGIEGKADKRAIYRLAAPELIELPTVGTSKELDLEGCLALKPDLAILPLKLKSAAGSLEEMGIPVILVNPESRELMLSMVELIAEAAGVPERFGLLRDFVAAQEQTLNAITGDRPTVYLGSNSSLLSTAGAAMYQSDLITLAGGINAAAELTDTYWAEISYEQLLVWDPEYIILASDAAYTVEEVLADPNLADCRAVKDGHVYHLPSEVESWDSPLPGGILGALWAASILHPDQVTGAQVSAAAGEFYERFYGFTYEMA